MFTYAVNNDTNPLNLLPEQHIYLLKIVKKAFWDLSSLVD